MMYKSQFKKTDRYDWFCGPGSHILDPLTPPNNLNNTYLLFISSKLGVYWGNIYS